MRSDGWTPADDATLERLYGDYVDWDEVARTLGRSANACKARVYNTLHLARKKREMDQHQSDNWTDREDELLRTMRPDHTMRQIAATLGRTVFATQKRWQFLKASTKRAKTKSMKGIRECLRCHHSFASDGPGNRICPGCQHTNRSVSSSPYALHL